MLKISKLNSHHQIFLIKVSACFAALLLGFFILAPQASMQDVEVRTVSGNANRMIESSNYRPTPEPPKSTIRGRVIYADTGRPVRRAGLMLLPAKGLGGGGGRENGGVTNERGEFEIRDVTEGRYFISVNTPGVVTPFSSLSSFERLRAAENEELSAIASEFQEVVVNGLTDIDITIVAKRGAAISGRIMYADGEAAIGVRVEILRKKDGQYNAVIPGLSEIFGAMFGGAAGGLKTDDRGVFRIAGLPAGEYVARVVENVSHSDKKNGRDNEMMMLMGFSPSSMVATYYPNTDDVKKAEVIRVELGQEQPEINITIPDRTFHTVSGIIINKATRQPVKNARISIKSNDSVNSLFSGLGELGTQNQSDEQGRWNYKDLPAGKYTLTIKPAYSYEEPDEKNSQKPKPPKLAQTEQEIIIEEKDLTDLVVELGYGAAISGTISFDNQQTLPPMMSVTAIDEKGKFSESANVYSSYSNDGKPLQKKSESFRIEGIPTGKVYLNLSSGRGYGEQEAQPFYIKSILLNGRDVNFSALEIKEGEEIKGVQIVLSKDVGKLKGKVLRADKSPVAGAKLLFVSTDKQKWGNFSASLYAATSGDGEFEVSGAPGEYFVVFIKDSNPSTEEDGAEKNPIEKRRAWLENEMVGAEKVTIKAKETENISLTVPGK